MCRLSRHAVNRTSPSVTRSPPDTSGDPRPSDPPFAKNNLLAVRLAKPAQRLPASLPLACFLHPILRLPAAVRGRESASKFVIPAGAVNVASAQATAAIGARANFTAAPPTIR